MQWFKYSFFLVLAFTSLNSMANRFSSVECLNSSYKTEIKNEGKFFGLLKNQLNINKDKCQIEIKFKGILETIWNIDICREPIHMKVTSKGSQNVYKREKECTENDKSDYCYFRNELMENIQDQGLIFAQGQKEVLNDSHGQTYCSYLLIQRYVDDGYVFSSFDNPKNIYEKQEACELPKKEEKKEVEAIMTTKPISTQEEVKKEIIQEPKASEERFKF